MFHNFCGNYLVFTGFFIVLFLWQVCSFIKVAITKNHNLHLKSRNLLLCGYRGLISKFKALARLQSAFKLWVESFLFSSWHFCGDQHLGAPWPTVQSLSVFTWPLHIVPLLCTSMYKSSLFTRTCHIALGPNPMALV